VTASGLIAYGASSPEVKGDTKLAWVDFSMEELTRLTSWKQTVFLDITADWCPNCKFNEKWVYDDEQVVRQFQDKRVVRFKADMTHIFNMAQYWIMKKSGPLWSNTMASWIMVSSRCVSRSDLTLPIPSPVIADINLPPGNRPSSDLNRSGSWRTSILLKT